MKQRGIKFKAEYLLLTCTGLFLCVLMCMYFYDKAALTTGGVVTERYVQTEIVRTKPEKINLNTAGQKELEQLPGIGEVLAERIIAYREENGPFGLLPELMNVSGIGEKKFAALEGFITVDGGDAP